MENEITHWFELSTGEQFVTFGELPYRIASALWPASKDDFDGGFQQAVAKRQVENELALAVAAGTLQVLNPLTNGPHASPVGDALKEAKVRVSELRRYLLESRRMGIREPVPAAEPGPSVADIAPAAVQRAAVQEAAIIASLRAATYDPKSLPTNKPGKPGVKAEIRAALGGDGMWSGSTVFDKAWERLMRQRDIAYRA